MLAFAPTLLLACTDCSGPLEKTYSPGLVVLSVLVAILASYAALDLVARVATSVGVMRKVWVAAGAVMMGLGIWSMHFVGMLALVVEMPVAYDVVLTAASMLLASLGALAALFVATRARLSRPRLILGGIFMGAAISAMHYTGMAGMRMQARLSYDPYLFALSVLIAVGASILGLSVALHLRADGSLLTTRRAMAASVMGIAIAGMHYTGMAAAIITPSTEPLVVARPAVGISYLGATAIGLGTLLGLGLTLLSSLIDRERRRSLRGLRFLADAGAVINVLEQRTILENTARLVVPGFADHCVIDLAGTAPDSELTRAVAGTRAGRTVLQLVEGAPRAPPSHPLARAFEAGESTHLAARDGAWPVLPGADAAENLEKGQPRSLIAVPISAGDRRFGAMLLTAAERHFQASDLLLAQEVARRVAAALEMSRLVRQLQQSVRARDAFLSVAAHELRTPLTPLRIHIQGMLRLAEEGRLHIDVVAERLKKADRQVTRFSQLVEQLLDMSRLTEGRLTLNVEPVDLGDVIRDITAVFSYETERAHVPVTLDLEGPLDGDFDRLCIEEILTNLLSNALKYGEGRPIEVGARSEGAEVRFWVRDQGMGVSEEDQERIFTRFERAVSDRNFGGLGLGLWIVRELTHAMGGTVDLQSARGAGATFTVRLPRKVLQPTRDGRLERSDRYSV